MKLEYIEGLSEDEIIGMYEELNAYQADTHQMAACWGGCGASGCRVGPPSYTAGGMSHDHLKSTVSSDCYYYCHAYRRCSSCYMTGRWSGWCR